MKTTLLTFALCLGGLIGFSQDLVSYKDENGKYGYKDKEGKVVIQPKYKEVQEFKSNDYAIADGALIDKMGNTILIDKAIKELNNLSAGVYLVSDAGQNEYWINYKDQMNSNGKHAKIDKTGKLISDWRNGGVSTIYLGRLLVTDYLFEYSNKSFDISYQIINVYGDVLSEKYTFFRQECDGYIVSTEKWNSYDQKSGTKLSKKYNNSAKYYDLVFYFDFTGKCSKVDTNFNFINDLPGFIEKPYKEQQSPRISFYMQKDSLEVQGTSSRSINSLLKSCP